MATPMEQFLLDNSDRHKRLISALKVKPTPNQKVRAQTSPDVVVCARVRPLLETEKTLGITPGVFVRPESTSIADVHELRQMVRGPPTLKSSSFEVDRCFGPDVSTELIHDNTVQHLVPWAWAGGTATLFAYGQTGSGKTFTVSQLQRLIAAQLMGGRLTGARKIHVTIIELAGNVCFDLLNSRQKLSILEDAFGAIQIVGAAEHEVKTTEELLTHIDNAASFRQTQATAKNDTSSRSHAICRLRVVNASTTNNDDGMLYLVDLAGSEAARDSAKHDADRMRETRQINNSLSVLKDCIKGRAEADMAAALGTSKKAYVPYRQSSLTKVLKHVFDSSSTGSSRTVVIACVNPSILDLVASRNTLRYAEMLRVLMPKNAEAVYDAASPVTWSNEHLHVWIRSNSGSPAIDGSTLAPTENGLLLLRLPPTEFEARCLKTEGVKIEQARAFRAKLWQLHVDSKAPAGTKISLSPGQRDLQMLDKSSSRHPDPIIAKQHFKQRLRPGMVVSWSPRSDNAGSTPGLTMAYILCPASTAGTYALDMQNQSAVSLPGTEAEDGTPLAYLCAHIKPGLLHESYEIQVWQQKVIFCEEMEAEVLLEYDPGTRYYFITL